ncbi:MAG TPA: alpha/beta hydrolase domain-containing protein [Kofleriaceae bacterium]|nr:alpha/beta hydrolase domain-containing protein [Kofleriaceae bacterium]
MAIALALGLAPPAAHAAGDDVTPFTVTLPTVTGPIASTPTNFPFGAEGFDVMPPVPTGYVVEEFFVSGTGRLYEFTPTGIRVVSPCPAAATSGCTQIPYTTRFLIKRPRNPREFSGTVIVEPLNPSGGFDISAVWDRSRDHFVRNGDIFIGWSSKSVIVNALKSWNPARYAALDWPYLPFVPGGNSGANDGITFDIAAQLGAWVKSNRAAGHPLRGLAINHVFESGFSQDGGFTFTQADVFHALERMPGGGPIYDGYVPMGTNGPSNINFGLTPAGALSATDPRRQMQPREVPVIHVDTETEIALGALSPTGLLFRRADGDARNDRYRLWEVPGAAHVSNDFAEPVTVIQLDLAQLLKIAPSQLPPSGCTHQEFVPGPATGVPGVIDPDDYPFAFVQNAAFERLTEWIEHDRPPPHAPQIQVDAGATPRAIVRDAQGNALGGVRTPFVDAPLASYVPTDTVAHTTALSGFCVLDGYKVPFDAARISALYRNKGDYVARVVTQSVRLVRDGFWLLPDAISVIERAARTPIP